jgi:hypothetical protein
MIPAKHLYLYLVTQSANREYDTYDAFVVCAENAEEAKHTHPTGEPLTPEWRPDIYDPWTSLENVHVQYLGKADPILTKGILCASYNAG